jgi:hypothetical protein
MKIKKNISGSVSYGDYTYSDTGAEKPLVIRTRPAAYTRNRHFLHHASAGLTIYWWETVKFDKETEEEMSVILWKRSGHKFTRVSHELPVRVVSHIKESTKEKFSRGWGRRYFRRLERLTKPQIELLNTTLAIGGE